MLIPFDDYPYHQIPTTFDHTGTSDLRFFDRYWFAVYDLQNRFAVNAGLGLYKNMDTMDGFGSVAHGGTQHNVRVARRLRPDWETLGAGPYRIEIIKPMQTFRIILDGPDQSPSFDLRWDATDPAFEEGHHFYRQAGWVEKDYRRFYQFGAVTGFVAVGGETYNSGASAWWGFRDRSFGVRPGVGGKMPSRGPSTIDGHGSTEAFLIGFALKTEDWYGCWQTSETASGEIIYLDGRLTHKDGHTIQIVRVEHDLCFSPNSRSFASGTFVLHDSDGVTHHMHAERFAALVYQGFGYIDGYWDHLGLGACRGDLLVESDRYDVADPAHLVDHSGHHDFSRMQLLETPSRIVFDGGAGLADSTAFVLPSYTRYAVKAVD